MNRNRELAKKYAAALVAVAQEQKELETVEEQLSFIRKTIRKNRELSDFLHHPMPTREAKKEVVKQLFAERVMELVVRFINLVIERGRVDVLDVIIEEFVHLSQAARNVQEAFVTSAIALTDDEEKQIVTQLESVTGKKILLNTTVDSDILGGMIVTIGDYQIDGSTARQLQEMKTALLKQDIKGLR